MICMALGSALATSPESYTKALNKRADRRQPREESRAGWDDHPLGAGIPINSFPIAPNIRFRDELIHAKCCFLGSDLSHVRYLSLPFGG